MIEVSIIIPVFNVEKYIENSLLSALNQDFNNVEYIIVDDCGTDNSMNIVNNIIKSFPQKNIKIVKHLSNKGLSEARNTGLKESSGKYIFFMDSDDTITPNCISQHYASLQKSNADFTVANINLEGAKSIHIKPILKDVENFTPIYSFLSRKWNTSAGNKLYKKDFITGKNIKFIPNIYFEDILWSFSTALYAKRISVVEDYTYNYKIHSNSITTQQNNSKKIDSLIYILDYLLRNQNKINDADKSVFNKYINFWRLNTAILLLQFNGSYKEQKKYYKTIKQIKYYNDNDLYNTVLKLPYFMFKFLIKPLYILYKKNR